MLNRNFDKKMRERELELRLDRALDDVENGNVINYETDEEFLESLQVVEEPIEQQSNFFECQVCGRTFHSYGKMLNHHCKDWQ